MNAKTIRVLVVDADPSGGDELRSLLDEIPGFEIVGYAVSDPTKDDPN